MLYYPAMSEREINAQITCDPRRQAFFLEDTDHNPEFLEGKLRWESDLRGVYRFAEVPTIHKSTLLDHAVRVNSLALLMSGYLAKRAGIHLDNLKLTHLDHHHDDAEVITGDIPSPVKAAFTPEERDAFRRREDEAMEQLAKRYRPERYQQLYLDDWQEVSAKQTPESQLVDIADKIDGLCETLTDIRCGNNTPEIYEVLTNYQKIFTKINAYRITKQLQGNTGLGQIRVPTREEAEQLPKIDLNLLDEGNGYDAFWQTVFDPKLPDLYQIWLQWTTFRNRSDLGIFSSWQDVLSEYPPLTLPERERLITNKHFHLVTLEPPATDCVTPQNFPQE